MSAIISPTETASRKAGIDRFRCGEQRVVLSGISWETYERLLEEMEERNPGVRLIYDRGSLEIACPSHLHERLKRLLGKAVEILAEEFDMAFLGGGATTFRMKELARGLEADECFWLQNAEAVLGREKIDLETDPPPDLVVEVDITTDSLDKLSIYASLRVPEVWRYDGQRLLVYKFEQDAYAPVTSSISFPAVPLEELPRFLERWREMDEGTWAKQFRHWVRETVVN